MTHSATVSPVAQPATDRDELASRLYGKIFSPHGSLAEHLDEALTLAHGLSDLIATHCDWADFHREDLSPQTLRETAKILQAFISMSTVMADALATERKRQTNGLVASMEGAQ